MNLSDLAKAHSDVLQTISPTLMELEENFHINAFVTERSLNVRILISKETVLEIESPFKKHWQTFEYKLISSKKYEENKFIQHNGVLNINSLPIQPDKNYTNWIRQLIQLIKDTPFDYKTQLETFKKNLDVTKDYKNRTSQKSVDGLCYILKPEAQAIWNTKHRQWLSTKMKEIEQLMKSMIKDKKMTQEESDLFKHVILESVNGK
ncbi:hypothetical protein EIN_151360 [Entamoeba invadens IP1]|uniref:Uncharacterized protein n=1 Tax=Entamoeba invadens IP1 TaxID=370355 RepID=A0A0A1U8K5_ENTIV|nr:hypothetical protein EIN_151360 [Entamoeba invadens IP1]ELP91239.1 hypothetical protein EIN_151360 [Entamoeba invadens IP1]|eukprot:XP_004258010.1 hypothetical protein EIN_151360 [Entamoeba invadens IP1]